MEQIEQSLKSLPNPNLHYLTRYLDFIKSRATKNVKFYEDHHILPRSAFPEFEHEKWNLRSLTPREHFIAHYLLFKAFPKNRKLVHAFWCMCKFRRNGRAYRITGRMYETIRNAYAESMLGSGNPFYGKTHSDEQKAKWAKTKGGQNNTFYGKTHDDETRARISKSIQELNKERTITLSESHKAAIAKSNSGKKKAQVLCEHCGKLVNGPSNYKRWHGDNCKLAK